MFSKPSFANRNDAITKKDARSVLGASPPPGKEAVPTPPPLAPTAIPDTVIESTLGARLIVGPDVKLKGAEILDCDTLVVEGRVEATMDSRVIRIAEHGAFAGTVSIDIAEIHGCFDGELTARSQLIIHATGKVTGKIRYGKLVIDEGGELCGDINAIAVEKPRPIKSTAEIAVPLAAIAG